jgi:hypothetical protein
LKYKFFKNTSYPSPVLVWLHKYCDVTFQLICGVWGHVEDIDFSKKPDNYDDGWMFDKHDGVPTYSKYAGMCDKY